MVLRRIFEFSLAFATLTSLATLPAIAQNGSTAQGGGSFLVQCPQYTPLHPAPSLAPSAYPTPTTSSQFAAQNYVGPASFSENVPDVPNPGGLTLADPRPPDERLYDSAVYPEGDARNRATFAESTCFVSLGVLDNPDLAFAKCDASGNFTFTGIPDGEYCLTVFDQWLDQLMFEKEIVVAGGQSLDIGTYPVFNWQNEVWSNTYVDLNGNGIQDPTEPGLIQVPTRIRFRNGQFASTLLSDSNGQSHFDELFPIFAWYTVESDTTRFRGTGVHTVYDAGGPPDSATTTHGCPAILNSVGIPPSGGGASQLFELPANLRVPGSVYCGLGDCTDANFSNYSAGGGPGGSTGRIDTGGTSVEGIQILGAIVVEQCNEVHSLWRGVASVGKL